MLVLIIEKLFEVYPKVRYMDPKYVKVTIDLRFATKEDANEATKIAFTIISFR